MKNNENLSPEIDALIGKKISEKIAQEMQQASIPASVSVIKDFCKLPQNFTFDVNCVYLLFNRKTAMKSFINGAQLDSLIGIYNDIRQNLLDKVYDRFTVGNYYAEFASCKLPKD